MGAPKGGAQADSRSKNLEAEGLDPRDDSFERRNPPCGPDQQSKPETKGFHPSQLFPLRGDILPRTGQFAHFSTGGPSEMTGGTRTTVE